MDGKLTTPLTEYANNPAFFFNALHYFMCAVQTLSPHEVVRLRWSVTSVNLPAPLTKKKHTKTITE